jgi:CheY-like chemotaxis protein
VPVVLVVSPDPAIHAAVVLALRTGDYTVVSAWDSEVAIARLRHQPADVVIGDVDDPALETLREYLRRSGLGELRPLAAAPCA